MISWSFYDAATGIFSGRRYSCDVAYHLEANMLGCAAIEGSFDPLSQRVDLSGEKPVVVDYQPPAPSADHEWNVETKRWQLTPAAADRANRKTAATARIAQLEASQHRGIREIALGRLGAAARLQAIDDEIQSLRSHL